MRLAEAFDSLASRRVILFGGKGGVGKTTISAVAALHYEKTGKVIRFSTDPSTLDAQKLYAKFLDENLQNLLEIGDRGTYLDRAELRRFFELSLPGVDELMAWMRIGELAEENEGAIVVVDTAPTGHTVRMLDAAAHFRRFAEALDALEEKHRGMVRQFMRRDVRDAIDDYIANFDDDARRRRELLTNPKAAAFVPVFLSEPWVVEQTVRLIAEVRQDGIDVPFAILNRAVLDADCNRDRTLQKRDAKARKRFAIVVDAPRSCVPLDSEEALLALLRPAVTGHGSRVTGAFRAEAPETCDLRPATKLLFLAGKGGVGKTTCAASIALQLAQRNPSKRYTVISVDPAHSLRDVFASESPPSNLSVEIIETTEKWRRLRETIGEEIERAMSAIAPGNMTLAYDSEAMRKLVDIAPPGADELFAISRLAGLAADESQEIVIVDTAPTGHFLRLLELPKTAGDWVREFMRILLRYRDLVPPGSLGQELVTASRAMKDLEATLHSDRSGVIVVTRPEKRVIEETRRLLGELKQRQIRVDAVIANYLTPANDCKCDRSMRASELERIAELRTENRELTTIERQNEPITTLAGLAALFHVASD